MRKLINELKELCYLSGNMALSYKKAGLVIEHKSDNSLVTNADKDIDDVICKKLKQLDCTIEIISEEGKNDNINDSSYWLVDPIDGTKGYIAGENNYTINIALIRNNIPLLGFIYHPLKKKLYYTDHNGKLVIEEDSKNVGDRIFNNNKPVSRTSDYIGLCGPNLNNFAKICYQNYFELNEIITIKSSIKLALIAVNKADIWFCPDTKKEWDIAAGHALINASGGKVINLDGEEIKYGKKNFVVNGFIALNKEYCSQNSQKLLKDNLENQLLNKLI